MNVGNTRFQRERTMDTEEIMRFRFRLCLLVPVIGAACGGVASDTIDAPPTRTINVQRSHGGSGTVTSAIGGIACGTACTATVPDGTVMGLTAEPDASAVFAGWSGPCTDSSPTCTFTVSGDVTIGAAFDVKRHTVTVVPAGNGAGAVTATPGTLSCPGTCAVSLDEGTQLTLTAAAQSGSVFLGWSGSGCTGTGPCDITVNADQIVTATFGLDLSLVVTKTGSGTGTVTSSPTGITCGADCSKVFSPGSVVTLTAVAASDSHFAGWTGGACTGTGTCAVTVNAAMMVEARFDTLCTLTVARQGASGGTVTSSPAGISCGSDCTEAYVCGTTVQLTAATAGSTTFAGWANGCTGTGICSVIVSASTTIGANFTACGNGIVESGEECDDGNAVNTDACTNACRSARCGDGIVRTGVEQCDDGNGTNGDNCENDCSLPRCGNGILDIGEECDDHNNANGDGCEANCRRPECGNGILDSGEQCDDGNAIDTDACTNQCRNAVCGDGIVHAGFEQCDDGNRTNGDGCENNCTPTPCPPPPVTSTFLFVPDVFDGNNCFGVNNIHHLGGSCANGNHREQCQVTVLSASSGTSCNFDSWSSSDPGDCGCNVRFITPADCFKGIHCSVLITQTTNTPPPPPNCQ